MSWIDKEIKKRTAAARHSQVPPPAPAPSESQRMAELWDRIEAANNALPLELRLHAEHDLPGNPAFDIPGFRVWLRAPNGAGLGFTGDALRYVWPERNARASHNFWIRWTPDRGFILARRVVSRIRGPKTVDTRFDPRRAEHIVRCLVVGRRIKPRTVRRKRLWLF